MHNSIVIHNIWVCTQDFLNIHVYFTISKSRTGEFIPDALSGVISCFIFIPFVASIRVFVCTLLHAKAYTPRELCIKTYPNI